MGQSWSGIGSCGLQVALQAAVHAIVGISTNHHEDVHVNA